MAKLNRTFWCVKKYYCLEKCVVNFKRSFFYSVKHIVSFFFIIIANLLIIESIICISYLHWGKNGVETILSQKLLIHFTNNYEKFQ